MQAPRRRRAAGLLLTGLTLTTIGALTLAGPGGAKITATPDREREFSKPASRIARAIAEDRDVIDRAAFSAISPGGKPAAVATTRLRRFPRHGKSYAILSTGDATAAEEKNDAPDFGVAQGGPFIRGARDVTIMKIKLRRPSKANCLSFRFRMLTEEFPEFVSSEFNDGFIAELDKSTWKTGDEDNPAITAPRNFATTADGKRISVNGAGPAAVSSKQAKGTTYDGATKLLRASTPISKTKHVLYLSVFDQGDRDFDTAVFIDRLTLDRKKACEATVVEDK